jgi:hypothetical protein
MPSLPLTKAKNAIAASQQSLLASVSMSNLPYAADADSPLKPEELAILRSQYQAEGVLVGVQTKFNYAWGLIKSTKRQEQLEGVKLLTGMSSVSIHQSSN